MNPGPVSYTHLDVYKRQLPPIVPKGFHIMLTVFHPETLYSMKKWLPFCEDLRKQYKHTPTPVSYTHL